MKSLILFAVLAVSFGSTAFTTTENPIKNRNTTTNCHNLDFTLINETGYNISSIFVSPTILAPLVKLHFFMKQKRVRLGL